MKIELATPRKPKVFGGRDASDPGEPSDGVFVGNLPWDFDEGEFKALFADCGEVQRIKYLMKEEQFTGNCFLDFNTVDEATKAGAEFRFEDGIESIEHIARGDVRIRLASGPVHANWIVDASGQACVLGRHFKTRRLLDGYRNISYYEHFEGVRRPDGDRTGFATLAMCREAWFWMIPIDDRVTSVGVVVDDEHAKRIPVPANRRLAWCIDRCPLVTDRMRNATGPTTNQVVGDFSYTCEPFAGDGWFMVGDAAAFIDPVWSTGVTLGTRVESSTAWAREVRPCSSWDSKTTTGPVGASQSMRSMP